MHRRPHGASTAALQHQEVVCLELYAVNSRCLFQHSQARLQGVPALSLRSARGLLRHVCELSVQNVAYTLMYSWLSDLACSLGSPCGGTLPAVCASDMGARPALSYVHTTETHSNMQ